MTYRGYTAIVEFDELAKTFTGRVVNSNALVSFRGDSPEELEESFYNAVDGYLEACAEEGLEPEKPYNGTISIRMDPETHKAAAIRSAQKKESLNQYVVELIKRDVQELQEA
ncbi:MAG: type II toxin-antitoxin system HicB family antitoxin [Alkalispirochaeta sp.]|jgi:predicted HicB family RNase H-like nuclease